jgi:hypothetical protein
VRWYDGEAKIVEATLTEARASHYYPSVTTILDVINKPGVEIWKQNILIDEAMRLSPIFADHEIDEFKETVRYRAAIKFSEAAELGTKWHSLLVNHLLGIDDAPEVPKETYDAVDEKLKDLDIHLEQHEVPFVNKNDGYAGTIDVIGYRKADNIRIPIVLDWKTQATNGRAPRYYDAWAMQLAAYAKGLSLPPTFDFERWELWNVALSTTDPGKVWFKRWKNQFDWWLGFDCALEIWCILNNFNPITGEKYKDE